MLWVKFATMEGRDRAVQVVKDMGVSGVWAAPDRPLEDRVVGSFLLGLKKLYTTGGT